MRTLEVSGSEDGSRLDRFAGRYLPKASPSFLQKMIRKKNIVVNGSRAEGGMRLKEGDVVTIYFSDETIEKFRSDATERAVRIPLSICYEDSHILAADKPRGMLTQGDRSGTPSLTDAVHGYLIDRGETGSQDLMAFRPSPAGRLDRNTGGLVLFGKDLPGQRALAESIRTGRLKREYLALVHGQIDAEFEDRSFLIRDEKDNRSLVLREEAPGAVLAHTGFRPVYQRDGMTLLQVRLYTGKTHQIRAVLSKRGYPIVGDPKYGNPDRDRRVLAGSGRKMQCLHAFRVTFGEEEGVLSDLSGKEIRSGRPDWVKQLLPDYPWQ